MDSYEISKQFNLMYECLHVVAGQSPVNLHLKHVRHL